MSSEVAESLREMASNLLAIASRLDGIDVSADAMRSGTVRVDNGDGTLTYRHGTLVSPVGNQTGYETVRVMTGRGFGVHVHRDPVAPLQIGNCTWPDGPCAGHRTGLGGMPLLTVPDDQAVHVPHRHAAAPDRPCDEIVCHETHGQPCRYCGGAPCRITPVERGA